MVNIYIYNSIVQLGGPAVVLCVPLCVTPCICVHVCVCMHVNGPYAFLCVLVYACACRSACVFVYVQVYVCVARTFVRLQVCLCVHVCFDIRPFATVGKMNTVRGVNGNPQIAEGQFC